MGDSSPWRRGWEPAPERAVPAVLGCRGVAPDGARLWVTAGGFGASWWGLERCSVSEAGAGCGFASTDAVIRVWAAVGSGEPTQGSFSASLVLEHMFLCPRREPDLAADCQETILLTAGLLDEFPAGSGSLCSCVGAGAGFASSSGRAWPSACRGWDGPFGCGVVFDAPRPAVTPAPCCCPRRGAGAPRPPVTRRLPRLPPSLPACARASGTAREEHRCDSESSQTTHGGFPARAALAWGVLVLHSDFWGQLPSVRRASPAPVAPPAGRGSKAEEPASLTSLPRERCS